MPTMPPINTQRNGVERGAGSGKWGRSVHSVENSHRAQKIRRRSPRPTHEHVPVGPPLGICGTNTTVVPHLFPWQISFAVTSTFNVFLGLTRVSTRPRTRKNNERLNVKVVAALASLRKQNESALHNKQPNPPERNQSSKRYTRHRSRRRLLLLLLLLLFLATGSGITFDCDTVRKNKTVAFLTYTSAISLFVLIEVTRCLDIPVSAM